MAGSIPPRKLKVLVIDDDPIVLEVARGRLEEAGYSVMVREHALGTVQQVREDQPDVVLLDVMMPALNGGSLATLLKGSARTRDAAIILYSSKPEAELAQLAQETGAIGSISKAARGEDFVRLFDNLVRRHFPSIRPTRP